MQLGILYVGTGLRQQNFKVTIMYKLTKYTSITRLSDNASIPADPANRDYQEYLAWVSDGGVPQPAQTLAETKTAQIAILTASCGAAIVAGFPSNALGTAYTYPSQPHDQTNLIGAVAGGLATINFWCADSVGVWGFTAHTALQIKQVLADGGTQRMEYSAKLLDLVTKVNAAATVVDVQAVVW